MVKGGAWRKTRQSCYICRIHLHALRCHPRSPSFFPPSFIPRQGPRCSGVVADSQSLFTESVRQAASGVRLCVPDIFADCFQSTRFRIPVTLRSDRKGEETMKRPLSGSWSMMRLLACTHLLEHVGNQEKEEGKERKKRGIKSERKI